MGDRYHRRGGIVQELKESEANFRPTKLSRGRNGVRELERLGG